jgi:microcystin-dependent protein
MKKSLLVTFLIVVSFCQMGKAQDAFIGEIRLFAGNYAPANWALCNGQVLLVNSNLVLFSIVGTTYGGDGTKTFALPDLRGRVPVGADLSISSSGLSNYKMGQKIGTETVTLTNQNLPLIKTASSEFANTSDPNGAVLANSLNTGDIYFKSNRSANVIMGLEQMNIPIPIVQPSLGLNYIICTNGLYPSKE